MLFLCLLSISDCFASILQTTVMFVLGLGPKVDISHQKVETMNLMGSEGGSILQPLITISTKDRSSFDGTVVVKVTERGANEIFWQKVFIGNPNLTQERYKDRLCESTDDSTKISTPRRVLSCVSELKLRKWPHDVLMSWFWMLLVHFLCIQIIDALLKH
jgi:hypothetical protein